MDSDRSTRVVYRYRPQVFKSLFAGAFMALGAAVFLALGLGFIPLPDDGLSRFFKGDIGRMVLIVLGIGWAFFALFSPIVNLIMAFGDCKVVLLSNGLEIPQLFGKARIDWRQISRTVISPIEVITPNKGEKKYKIIGYMLRIYKKKDGLFGLFRQRWVSSICFDSEQKFFDFVNQVLERSGCRWEEKSMPLGWLAKVDAKKLERTLNKWS